MKKFYLLTFLLLSAYSAWAGPNFDVSFDGMTATITSKAPDGQFYDLANVQDAQAEFGDDWATICQCTTLVFVGNVGPQDTRNGNPFQAFENNSAATTVDFSEAKFNNYQDNVFDHQLNQNVSVTVSSMSFKAWQNTITTAITSNYLEPTEIYKGNNTLFGNAPSNLTRVVFNSGTLIGQFGDNSQMSMFTLEIGPYVTTIKDDAMRDYSKLETLEMRHASALSYVGVNAFQRCHGLVEVEMGALDGTCVFGKEAFANCEGLKHFTMAEGVPYISEGMFDGCVKLESIRIPTTCRYIDKKAFNLCKSFHVVTIPDNVEWIGQDAFQNAGVTDIYLMAKQVEKIPKIYAFDLGVDPTFDKGHGMGNGAYPDPDSHNAIIGDMEFEDILHWYQDELSGDAGIGLGNSIILLHYPDEVKEFYEGIDPVTTMEGVNWDQVPGCMTKEQYLALIGQRDINKMYQVAYKINYAEEHIADDVDYAQLPVAYYFDSNLAQQWISDVYHVNVGNLGNSVRTLGPDANGRYYPMQDDCQWLRTWAGMTSSAVQSQWGWRQFPLSTSIGDSGEIPFTKEYDDTWYTMCFPWKIYDEQLFRAFNQKCEIAEFVGAEILENEAASTETEKKLDIIFHFDKVAATHYVDDNNVEYTRVKIQGQTDPSGNNVYTYTPIGGGTTITYNSDPTTDEYKKYYKIQNIMAFPGHPYMIHPSVGAARGVPSPLIFDHLKKVEVPAGKTLQDVLTDMVDGKWWYSVNDGGTEIAESQDMADWGKVTVTATTATRSPSYDSEGKVIGFTYDNIVPYQDENGHGGKYTFIGNIDKLKANGTDETQIESKMMPKYSYFLALPDASAIYPKYYRKTQDEDGKWSPFTAVIQPDADAARYIESFVVPGCTDVTNDTNILWGEWEEVSTDEINQIVADAESRGEKVNKATLNVVFTVNGQVVRTNSNSVEGLPSGLYIVNGKKYIVK